MIHLLFFASYSHKGAKKKLKITAKEASSMALIDSGGVTFRVRIEASRALNFSGCDGRSTLSLSRAYCLLSPKMKGCTEPSWPYGCRAPDERA